MRYGCVIDIDVNTSFSQVLTPEFQLIMPCDNYKL